MIGLGLSIPEVAVRGGSWILAPGGILPSHDIDFAGGRAWVNGTGFVSPASLLTVTRASQETITDTGAKLSYAGSGAAALSNAGLQVWESRTNVVLWNNDLTNAAWTASNVTAAKDQTGPDNILNSASSILATAGSATILQAITLSSAARFQTAYVKRLIGSGAINMTMDNGSTWTAVTVTVGWTRVSIPTQTLANPTVGFQIVTNGDKIAVALVQNENGTFATPAIPTTTAAVTRAADAVKLATPPSFGSAYTMVAWGIPTAPAAFTANQQIGQIDAAGSTSNRILADRSLTSGNALYDNVSGGAGTSFGSTNWPQNTLGKTGMSTTAGSQIGVFNGGAPSTNSIALPVGVDSVRLGATATPSSSWNGNITRFALWPTTALSAAALQQTTR